MKAQESTWPSDDDVRRDVALLERIAARDGAAVGELYDRHSALLYSLILRILRVPGEAEEVLQDVFVTVWNRVGTYNTVLGSPAGWLVRIARNRAIDRLRTNTAYGRAVSALPTETPASGNPESDASLGERQRAVVRALAALTPDQRVLIEEAYYFGFTQSELAERHNLPLGTVKTRIRTGFLALRGHLSQKV